MNRPRSLACGVVTGPASAQHDRGGPVSESRPHARVARLAVVVSLLAAARVASAEPTTALTFVQANINGQGLEGLNGVGQVAISPDGRHAYASGASDDDIAIFGRSSSDGTLAYLGRRVNLNSYGGAT